MASEQEFEIVSSTRYFDQLILETGSRLLISISNQSLMNNFSKTYISNLMYYE